MTEDEKALIQAQPRVPDMIAKLSRKFSAKRLDNETEAEHAQRINAARNKALDFLEGKTTK